MIDLRSDTVTKPTPDMLDAMHQAEVGDDLFGEDPTVIELENKLARLFGKDAAVFCPSGTMTNQIAVKIHTQPGDQMICDKTSHIYHYETGGAAFNSGVSCRMLDGNLGRFTAEQVLANINPDAVYLPKTAMISIENTSNKGGGSIWDMEEIKRIAKVAALNNLGMHLDGARIFNALVDSTHTPKDFSKYFHTISVCLSKGLGAPIGSVLIGSNDSIKQARRVRKMLGGAMRQAGYLAAAGIYALDHHMDRLKEDHIRAAAIAETFKEKPYVTDVIHAGTNIVLITLSEEKDVNQTLAAWKEKGLLAVPFGGQQIRFVTHMDFDDDQLEQLKVLA